MKALTFLKIITVVNLSVASGFSLAGIIDPGMIVPAGTSAEKSMEIFALYAAARTIPLALITIASINKQWSALSVLAFLAGSIQLLDGFIGIYQHDVAKSAGPFVIAITEFLALYLAKSKLNIDG